MGFIERELDRIAAAIADPTKEAKRGELYAAQQALKWTTEPQGFAAPFDVVMGNPPTGTLAEPASCLGECRPTGS